MPVEQLDDLENSESHYRHLARGFNWLGGTTVIAKVIDFSTILAVLFYLSKAQVGIASLVISVGMVVEAFDGLGTSEAMIQAGSVSRLQLDSLFWFILGVAATTAGVVLLAAPFIEKIYGVPGMAAYFFVIAAKQPLVGAAVIPLALLNRQLQYERIAAINVLATLAAAVTRFGLAVGGAGAWALVGAFASSGLYILIGTLLFNPYWPRLRFRWPEILPLVRFGLRATSSNIFEQIFKNVDFLLIGKFFGAAELGVYRVAFDVAMEPAVAIGALVNRTALPVFARVSQARDRLAQSFTWSLRRLVSLVAPLMAGLILVAHPLMTLLRDGQGSSYVVAALPLQLLAGAALLRVSSQLLMPLLLGTGRPGTAALLSAATLVLLGTGILAACLTFGAQTGLIAVSAVWLGVYPLLLIWGVFYLRRLWGFRAGDLGQAFIAPLIGIAAMAAAVLAVRHVANSGNLNIQIGIVLAAMILTYAGLFFHVFQGAVLDSEVPSMIRIVIRAWRVRLVGGRPRRRPVDPKRILVAPHLRLGDAILITPLIAKLREQYPAAEIVLISSPPMVPLYQGNPYGVVVWPYHPRRFETVAAMIRRDGFDLAVVPGDNRNGWLAAALRAKWIVAHAGDRPKLKSWMIDELIEYPLTPAAMGEIFAELAPGPGPRPYQVGNWPAPACRTFDLPSNPYVVLHVGANVRLKFWPPEKWFQLARWFDEQSLDVVWSGGSGEEAIVEQIDPEKRYRSYAGHLDLAQMWRLIAHAVIFISPDTGVAHLARLTGVPAVSLFGPGSPQLFGRGEFWRDMPCAEVTIENFPCRDQQDVFERKRPWVRRCGRSPRECTEDGRCMKDLSVAAVVGAVNQLLTLHHHSRTFPIQSREA